MSNRDKHIPLSERQLGDIVKNLWNSDSEVEYESEVSCDDFLMGECVSDEEDHLEICSEEDPDEEPPEDDGQVTGPNYTAKSGLVWNAHPFPRTRRRQRNIVNIRPGITEYSACVNTLVDCFNLFITSNIKDIICLYTNQEASVHYNLWNLKNPTKTKQWKTLEHEELDCYLGVLIKAGALRCRKESTKEMWTTNTAIRRSFFTAALARNRFDEISVFLRFDDKTTRPHRKEYDKLAAIREVWDIFVDNCNRSFEPYEHITIDEQLVCFCGKCPFRQYIKSKPGRYGIKIWAAADVRTSYLCNLQVYTGKLPGNVRETNQGQRVVSDLTQLYHGSGRGITTDNFCYECPLS